jgi:hypothetical protein
MVYHSPVSTWPNWIGEKTMDIAAAQHFPLLLGALAGKCPQDSQWTLDSLTCCSIAILLHFEDRESQASHALAPILLCRSVQSIRSIPAGANGHPARSGYLQCAQ